MMQPATDPDIDYKLLVRQGYDRCAQAYAAARQGETCPQLARLTSRLPGGVHVLDIGCGAGVPIDRVLAQRFRVTGVDISGELIRLARQNVPTGTFIHADVMAVDFPAATFDGVVSFYTIFHLPREEHADLFLRIRGWLKTGGVLLATMASEDETSYTEDDFFGVRMYWSNYGLDTYCRLLPSLGFQLLETTIITNGYTEEQGGATEQHPLIFALAI